jgi:hypothetical protein
MPRFRSCRWAVVFDFDRVISHAPAGYGHGVMQRWNANSVKGALVFGSGLFLTTHFLGGTGA